MKYMLIMRATDEAYAEMADVDFDRDARDSWAGSTTS